MEKVREMNESIFHDNLLMTINEILDIENLNESMLRFKILPVYEKDKSFNGLDNLMRLVALSEKNVGNRLLTIEETVKLVACKSPFVPIWINVSLNKVEDKKIILNFRKPSLLRNAETGHPPFKAVI